MTHKPFPLLILSVVNILEGGGLFWEKVCCCIPDTDIYPAEKMSLRSVGRPARVGRSSGSGDAGSEI